MGSQIDAFKKELENAKTKEEADNVYKKYRSAIVSEDAQTDWEAIKNVRKRQLPADDFIYSQLESLSKIADQFDKNEMFKIADYIDSLIKNWRKYK